MLWYPFLLAYTSSLSYGVWNTSSVYEITSLEPTMDNLQLTKVQAKEDLLSIFKYLVQILAGVAFIKL